MMTVGHSSIPLDPQTNTVTIGVRIGLTFSLDSRFQSPSLSQLGTFCILILLVSCLGFLLLSSSDLLCRSLTETRMLQHVDSCSYSLLYFNIQMELSTSLHWLLRNSSFRRSCLANAALSYICPLFYLR